ncbi:hypothetical protein E2C01_066319 [Portunus trituberculatus]|uniref:Uncharacterized protein n=1 Tax=Portunus trituberculatus TaxID=210409 RepID=A0A5B7HPY8_PORTR|nr:hypothetical protein [Portunus trituberculatus]
MWPVAVEATLSPASHAHSHHYTGQSTTRAILHSAVHSISQTGSQAIFPSLKKLINPFLILSPNQPASHSATKTARQPITNSLTQPTSQPDRQPQN